MDIDAQIDAVDRALTTGTRDGAETHVQTLAQTYRAPIDDVWDAFTSAERLPRWFLPVSGELRLGGGASVPHLLDRVRVAARDRDDPRFTRLERAGADRAGDSADPVGDVGHERSFRRPRASSVASASSGGVQKRRNASSQASTSWNGSGRTA